MPQPFEITVDSVAVRAALAQLTRKLAHPAPLMQDIGRALGNLTEDSFQGERSPAGMPWRPLTPDYVLRPRKQGGRGGDAHPVLQRDGGLAASITHGGDDRSAWVGASKIYAAIHQFGGTADMAPGPAGIPARPFLPVGRDGYLAGKARDSVLALVKKYLAAL